MVLALVANRERALVPGLAEVDEDSCYAVIRIPQVMFGMAVSEEGIPSRVRSCPGGTREAPVLRQGRDDLPGWQLGRMPWVADREFSSRANRSYLIQDEDHYLREEKLRGDSKEARLALSRRGRYRPRWRSSWASSRPSRGPLACCG
ncbi:MAG: hypothetical protein ACYDC5_08910 [Candidatus Dormibacteria bacterium]